MLENCVDDGQHLGPMGIEEKVVIIGAGPAGLMASQILAEKGFKVQIFEQNIAAGRKFLVAGYNY